MKEYLKAKVKSKKAKVKKTTSSTFYLEFLTFYLGFFTSETLTSRFKRDSGINGEWGFMVLHFLMVGSFEPLRNEEILSFAVMIGN
ncbi:MAG: hypothetical protein IEMM0006_2133 [bacterium]|nr:MAG: hypothetical protein IEMM0006_2133 [bacterium]